MQHIDKFLEIQYVNRLGVYLTNFKQVKSRNWVFSHTCETAKPGKKLKARGSIYEIKENTTFNVKCFHCGYSVAFTTLLKETAPVLYDEYQLHRYRDQPQKIVSDPVVVQEAKTFVDANLEGLIPITKLAPTSAVMRWIDRRKIPRKHYKLMYVAKNFYKWASRYKPEFKESKDDSPRLVLPYFDLHGRVIGFTARTFAPKVEPRYIHLRLDKDIDFVYGTERIDPSKKIYVCEGQIDSFFVDNCVAVGGANYSTPFMNSIKSNCVIIPDSDWKRNSQVAKQLKKAIVAGFSVCMLPDNISGKDLNDIVKAGLTIEELKTIIDRHTYTGLTAQLEFAMNKKF